MSERRLRLKKRRAGRKPVSLSPFPLTCAPARSPLRSACSAPKSSERRRSPLAARTAAAEEDAADEGESIIGVVVVAR